ncbi:MAG: glutamine synthetase III [Kiritimatiellia bacterium]
MTKDTVTAEFGENVFNVKVMRNYLSNRAYQSLSATILKGEKIDPSIAGEVAEAMKAWAMERGATHYTHWFQPLTGTTAEKHDSFFNPDGEGGVLAHFSGKELSQGEPDASSFPSGGLRATFEARGYTAWDPSSPAFIKKTGGVSVLCIPTLFCGYHGEALDKKTPLMRSQEVLAKQVERVAKLFDIPCVRRTIATLGPEQEYFLIDAEAYRARPDLIQTGRTLFGRRPPRHQQMEDHYFGRIQPRILSFMADLDHELWRLGVPAKTRHNEVAPAQFEIAPVFEDQNLAIDHNMVTMQLIQEVAERHGLVALLHEKPFAGVNGSGKHNNFSITGPDGKNWLSPGDTPHENAKFLLTLCAIIKAVDAHADILRASVASAGNDHRLGANEAPPAIISIYLGAQLTDIVNQIIADGNAKRTQTATALKLGVSMLPPLPRDATDRNRTSPMAFTGNKFEFRAAGSSQSCSGANVVLNTTVAWALDELVSAIEARMKKGEKFIAALHKVLSENFKAHKRVLFDGDNYTDAWKQEAKARGLPNVTSTLDALKAFIEPASVELFTKYGVFTERELQSRYEIYAEAYVKTIGIEAGCALEIGRTYILPVALDYLVSLGAVPAASRSVKKLSDRVAELTDDLASALDALESAIEKKAAPKKLLDAMASVRAPADELEGLVPANKWLLPSYAEMFFN